ncbi:hypothetical protein [uncultured Roseovarius sp.]|uniref:hypothetical protein n=1 Tax=uncultured Roseovarius sp. TaxID=293344 RepID=UPI00259993D8|nr:hypothetical protein [uncultured Roseovarius sp.]MDW3117945.1 hypothetical protein [Roseovarius pacificus]
MNGPFLPVTPLAANGRIGPIVTDTAPGVNVGRFGGTSSDAANGSPAVSDRSGQTL